MAKTKKLTTTAKSKGKKPTTLEYLVAVRKLQLECLRLDELKESLFNECLNLGHEKSVADITRDYQKELTKIAEARKGLLIAVFVGLPMWFLIFLNYITTGLVIFFFVALAIALTAVILGTKHFRDKIIKKIASAAEVEKKRVEDELAQRKLILTQVVGIDDELDENRALLKKFLDLGIIYPKYRNLVAVSSFCEYFDSGRCDKFEGHEGAYNMYEDEVRQNVIIGKLDLVRSNLDDIKQGQHLLYSELTDMKMDIDYMRRDAIESARDMKESQALIENNTRLAAKRADDAVFWSQLNLIKDL